MTQAILDHPEHRPEASMQALSTENLDVYYGDRQALSDVTLEIPRLGVTAFIGPSGCGKSTLLRTFNRMNDRIPSFYRSGRVRVAGEDPYARGTDLLALRRRVGMLFQKANPFPKSIFENVAIGPRAHYGSRGSELCDRVEQALRRAALWNEVKDEIRSKPGHALSGGQQQRLCLARMLAVDPEIVLMDEPCSALDPHSTARIEELMVELGRTKTVVVVTHNLQQAHRVSDHTAFFLFGEMVEWGETEQLFSSPRMASTKDYVSGVFG